MSSSLVSRLSPAPCSSRAWPWSGRANALRIIRRHFDVSPRFAPASTAGRRHVTTNVASCCTLALALPPEAEGQGPVARGTSCFAAPHPDPLPDGERELLRPAAARGFSWVRPLLGVLNFGELRIDDLLVVGGARSG